MRFSICNEIFQGWDLERIFEYASRLGYDGVEIAPFTLCSDVRKVNTEERRKIREAASSHNLQIPGIHWALVTPKGLHITHPKESVRRFTQEYLCELVKFNSDIGGKVIVFGSPQQRNILNGVSEERAWNLASTFFHNCSKFAEDYDITIAIEPLARHLTNFINTSEEALKLIKEVNHPNFKLILDVYSMTDEEKPIEEIIRGAGSYLVHFHVNDDNERGPGFGGANYHSVVGALKEIGYKGFVSVEVFDFSQGPEEIAEGSLENLRRFWGLKS